MRTWFQCALIRYHTRIALVGMFILGFMNVFVNGPFMAIMQKVVPNQMQGRVMSLLNSAGGLMTPLSLILAGPISDRVGLQVWYIVGGVICALMALVIFASPSVMHIEDRAVVVGMTAPASATAGSAVKPTSKPARAN